MKRIMTIIAALILWTIIGVLMLWTIPVLAYDDQQIPDISLMVIIFFGLGVVPIVSQLIPNLIHFCSILRDTFAKIMRKSDHKAGTNAF